MKSTITGAIVTSVTRRWAEAWHPEHGAFHAKLRSKAIDATVGDLIDLEKSGNEWAAIFLHPPKHRLARCFDGKIRTLVSRCDRVFIVMAPPPLWSFEYVNRILAVTTLRDIRTVLVVNKSDLNWPELEQIIKIYTALNVIVLPTSAKTGENIAKFLSMIMSDNELTNAFIGPSGVGKSSLINALSPELDLKIGEVGDKTKKGKHTTSHPKGYVFSKSPLRILFDLPGLSQFGLQHLDIEEIKFGFEEIRKIGQNCKFSNCAHINEPACCVISAVEDGNIELHRYESYRKILEETKEIDFYLKKS